ncbi:hypothetical protein GCM10010172_24870 [Paractinoplanes ferrugineus]|uniref:DUF4349 domain-containing protein n=1 Tax=Paractinoplanes ferrugineus TaxID=113564 RepID=A0A919IUZ3_9ACTN|nr:DUF4349 domain-containing protein [Actinoplanes ferrugineus]GIE08603.1 hypothetical protein Afe05nite_04430 [Actinoplanes ferrugineus]
MRVRPALLITTALVAGIILSGCGADSSDSSGSSAGMSGSKADAPAGAQAERAPDQAQGKDTAAQAPDLGVDQRSIIYRGSLSVRVKDINAEAARATGVAQTAGGFVGGDNRNSSSTGSGTATLTLRVPADKFATTVDSLSKLGDEQSREISTEDVTEQTVDLDARIAVQEARVASGRKLLGQAKSLDDLVMLEKEVATRESDLASLQAKKRRLADLTALSTITVTFLGPETPGPKKDDDPAGFLGGLSAGWHALLASLGVLLTVLGALLPWIIAIGLPVWAIWWALKRWQRNRPPRPVLAATGAGALPIHPAAGNYAGRPATFTPPSAPPAPTPSAPPFAPGPAAASASDSADRSASAAPEKPAAEKPED